MSNKKPITTPVDTQTLNTKSYPYPELTDMQLEVVAGGHSPDYSKLLCNGTNPNDPNYCGK